jgi:hypothetical protein
MSDEGRALVFIDDSLAHLEANGFVVTTKHRAALRIRLGTRGRAILDGQD